MDEVSAGPAQGAFTTDAFPEGRRLAMFRDSFPSDMLPFDIEPVAGAWFFNAISTSASPGLEIARGASAGTLFNRTTAHARAGDDFTLCITRSGRSAYAQRGETSGLEAGEAFFSAIDVTSMSGAIEGSAEVISLRLPRIALMPALVDIDRALKQPIRAANDGLRLLTGYMDVIGGALAGGAADTQRVVVSHVYDLVALALGQTAEAAEIGRGRGQRAARLHGIKADIRGHLASPDLSLGAVAARQGVSPSYVRKLFEGEGDSFSGFVLGQRLSWAHAMLRNPRFGRFGISDIAYEAGFGDLSYFNRAFRRRYGATPSEVRAREA